MEKSRTWRATRGWCGCTAAAWFQGGPADDDDKKMLGEWVLSGYRISSTARTVRVVPSCRVHFIANRIVRLLKGA